MDHGETVKDNLNSEHVDNLTIPPARETPDPSLLKQRFETAITVITGDDLGRRRRPCIGLRLPFTLAKDYRVPKLGAARA